jgi:hypothetical protein
VWNWFWDFPKYLLVLLVLSWLVERLHRLLPLPSAVVSNHTMDR